MSNVTAEQAEQSQQSDSTANQVKEAVGGAVGQVQEQAQQVRGQARDRVSQELTTRSTQAGQQLRDTAGALRQSGQSMRSEGKPGPAADAFDQVADRAERLASYLSEANGDRMLRDVERFARRQPWAFTVGGVVAGFFAARFLKASSEQRFQGGGDAMYRSGPAPAQRPALPSPAGDGLTTPGVSGVDGR
jgi:hypothetical protein